MEKFDFYNVIWNYYGTLEVWEEKGKYYWQIDDAALDNPFAEIPKYLYDALKKHYEELMRKLDE